MRFNQIGLALTVFVFLTPAFAIECPPAEKVLNCRGDNCSFQQLPGWNGTVFFTDQGKPFSFQTARIENTEHGKKISCYYTYFDPDTHKLMPPALVLRRQL